MKNIIKEEQWVMLPTNRSNLFKQTKSALLNLPKNKLFLSKGDVAKRNGLEPQHLYLTSDDRIELGDWGVFGDEDGWHCIEQFIEGSEMDLSQWKKIIATTDRGLKGGDIEIAGIGNTNMCDLPNIPESFIRHYVEKQGKVGDVEVEYTAFIDAPIVLAIKTTLKNEIIIHIPPPIHVGAGETFMDRVDEVITVYRAEIRDGVYQNLADHLGFKETAIVNHWVDGEGEAYVLTKLGFKRI